MDPQSHFFVTSLSFLSLVLLFPWSFSRREIPWSFRVFSAYFPGFLRVRQMREILGLFEVFLGCFRKDQGKEGQGFCYCEFCGVSGSAGQNASKFNFSSLAETASLVTVHLARKPRARRRRRRLRDKSSSSPSDMDGSSC